MSKGKFPHYFDKRAPLSSRNVGHLIISKRRSVISKWRWALISKRQFCLKLIKNKSEINLWGSFRNEDHLSFQKDRRRHFQMTLIWKNIPIKTTVCVKKRGPLLFSWNATNISHTLYTLKETTLVPKSKFSWNKDENSPNYMCEKKTCRSVKVSFLEAQAKTTILLKKKERYK